MPKGARFPIITSTNAKLKPWRNKVALAAQAAMKESGFGLIEDGPIRIDATFYFMRPRSRRAAGKYKFIRTDLDKHLRAVADSLTNVAYRDDAQIAVAFVQKVYGEADRTEISIAPL